MRRPVIGIFLDAVEPSSLERWIADGALPTLARLREQSARCALHGVHPFTGELPTHALLTAAHPAKAGYWGAFNYGAPRRPTSARTTTGPFGISTTTRPA